MPDGSADFTLSLRNQVTGPARAMRRSIQGLSSDLRDKQRFFEQGETAFQKKLKESRRLADTAHRQELRAMREKRTAGEKAAASADRLRLKEQRAQRGRLQDRFDVVMRRRRAAQRLAQQRDVAFQRGLVRHQQAVRRARERAQMLEGVSSPGGGAGALLSAGGFAVAAAATAAAVGLTLLAAKFTSATVAALDFSQRSKTALASIFKDGQIAAQQFGEVRREAGQLGLDVMDTVDQFKMLANSGFDVSTSRQLVRMSADLQALTGSSESAAFALRAISQIKMKGRLQAEEITGQLAEHGVSADEVYRVLGTTLGKTRQEILKMQKAGELSADVAIPAILQAVRNQLGVEQSGGFAMKINASSVGGMWRTLKGQVQNAFISLGEQVGPGITRAFSSIMASIQSAVASPQMAELGRGVVDLFNAASAFVQTINFGQLLRDAAAFLTNEITAAATFIRDHGVELREAFVRFVTAMGTGLQMAVNFFKPFVDFATSDFGKFLFTPLNETFGDEDAIKESRARMAANAHSSSAASQAGTVMGGTKIGDVRFGDIHVHLDGAQATPEAAGGAIVAQVRREMMSMLQDF